MKRVTGFLLGLVIALAGASFAVTGGGFPSRPTFQAIGVGTAPSATNGVINARQIDATGATVGHSCGPATTTNCFGNNTPGQTAWAAAVIPAGGTGNVLGLLVQPLQATNSTDVLMNVGNSIGQSLFEVDGGGNITATHATSVPWAASSVGTQLGACLFKLTYNGAAAPTIASARGCGSTSAVRNAAGNYSINGSTITTSMGAICSIDQNSFVVSVNAFSSGTITLHTLSPLGTQADPSTGQTTCAVGL